MAVGLKAENRLKLHKKAKLVSTLGRMTCKTRMGRENATAGQAELKLRLGDDQRSQVGPLPLKFGFSPYFTGLLGCSFCSNVGLITSGVLSQPGLRQCLHDSDALSPCISTFAAASDYHHFGVARMYGRCVFGNVCRAHTF